MLEIWGRPTSICTQRVLWACNELSLEYQLTLASATMGPTGHVSTGASPFGVVDTPVYEALNPNRTVPMIKDGDYTLWESNAIVTYLAMQYGAELLYQSNNHVLAHASQWMAWTNEHLEPPLHTLVMELVRLDPPLRDVANVEPAQDEVRRWIKILDSHLATTPFVCGEHFSLGDITTGASTYRANLLGVSSDDFINVAKWQNKLSERIGFQLHIAPNEFHIG